MGSDAEIKAGRAGSRPSGGVGASVQLGLGRLRAGKSCCRAPGANRAPLGASGHTCAGGWLGRPRLLCLSTTDASWGRGLQLQQGRAEFQGMLKNSSLKRQ